jgi:epoxyqueuosine reductase
MSCGALALPLIMPTPISDPHTTSHWVKGKAQELGFDLCRITRPDSIPQAPERLQAFLSHNYHASMNWMEERADQRSDPRQLWPEVKSIIMLGMNYGPETNPLELLEQKSKGAISVYARHRDYHDVIKGKLKMLGQSLMARCGGTIKVFVDTAPVMEKPLAASAGLGWQGKHTNLVSRDFGSWLFLGSLFTTLDLPADDEDKDLCGSCRACLDICPTQAFPVPYQLDARRCLSYLTIEHKGSIPEEFRAAMGNRIYGCDDCLAVCPWNKFAQNAREAKLQARDDLKEPDLAMFLAMDEARFRRFFSGSPIKRIGWARFMRNCLIAAGNSDDRSLLPFVRVFEAHEDAMLQDTAHWAAKQLQSPAASKTQLS